MNITGREPGMSFYIRGSDDEDSLFVQPDVGNATVILRIPVRALPWRDIRIIEKHGPRLPYGCGGLEDPLAHVRMTLEGPQVIDRTGIQGATWLRLEEGIATVQIEQRARLVIPCLRVEEGARVPTAVQVTGDQAPRARGTIHVFQLSGGRRIGGVALELGNRD